MAAERRFRIFACGTLLPGESDHHLIEGATSLGAARTKAIYHLVEVKAGAALLQGGRTAIVGEVFDVDVQQLAACDIERQHPVLFERKRVELDGDLGGGGGEAWAYFLSVEQSRGLRRVRGGDWKQRFVAKRPESATDPSGLVRWARDRYKR